MAVIAATRAASTLLIRIIGRGNPSPLRGVPAPAPDGIEAWLNTLHGLAQRRVAQRLIRLARARDR
jgi:hypothetical protein